MAISVISGSASIGIIQKPQVQAPNIVFGGVATPMSAYAHFSLTDPVRLSGSLQLTGSAGESATGNTLGFIQAQYVETNWVYYRGQTNNDGSVFLQRARSPARPQQSCRDTVHNNPNVVWYNSADNKIVSAPGNAYPITLSAAFFDKPSETCPLMTINSKTKKTNYLHEAQFEFAFCAVLALRDSTSAGVFNQLLHVYWNTRWQYKFKPKNFAQAGNSLWTVNSVRTGTRASVSSVFTGAATDPRFSTVLTGPVAQSCNRVFQNATANPNRYERTVWINFNVK